MRDALAKSDRECTWALDLNREFFIELFNMAIYTVNMYRNSIRGL